MFFINPLQPALPEKTVCLTFDDGPDVCDRPPSTPGPQTREIARFLAAERISATFFMVGRHLEQHGDIAAETVALGHLVGNHTFDHMDLVALHGLGGDVVRQLGLTSPLLPSSLRYPIYFRAPYGRWSEEVAQALNADFVVFHTAYGPMGWNVQASDWDKWWQDWPLDRVVAHYLEKVEENRGGIVPLHDTAAARRHLRMKNRSLELTRHLVRRLRDRGFGFVGLDQVFPEAARPLPFRLAAQVGGYLCTSGESGRSSVALTATAEGNDSRFTAVPLGMNRFAIQCSDGSYLSSRVSAQGGKAPALTAGANTIGDGEIFDVTPVYPGRLLLRNCWGLFLGIENDGQLGSLWHADERAVWRFLADPPAAE